MLAIALVGVLAANFVSQPGTISVVRSCPLAVSKATLEPGTGFDRDSLYANFFIVNGTDKEFLYTYKLQLRSARNRSEVREQVGSSPILPHSKGWYREFVGVEFAKPASYALQQGIISCVSTGS